MAFETVKQVQIILYIEAALLGLGLVAVVSVMGFEESILNRIVEGAEYYEVDRIRESYRADINQGVAFTCACLIFLALMNLILYLGIRRKDDTKLDAWFIVHGMVLILMAIVGLYAIKGYPGALAPKKNVQTIIYVAYRIWSLVVLNKYVGELRAAERANGRPELEEEGAPKSE